MIAMVGAGRVLGGLERTRLPAALHRSGIREFGGCPLGPVPYRFVDRRHGGDIGAKMGAAARQAV